LVASFVVGAVSEMPPGSRRQVRAGGRDIAVFNVGGTFYALKDTCPHRGARLSAGSVVGGLTAPCAGAYEYDGSRQFVKCPWHGWEFDLATGRSYCEPERERVRAYPVSVERREPGPYVAETVPVAVEDDYVVVEV
jgi:nitrite reductase/ring-hydroxylating ferredoxin subunit